MSYCKLCAGKAPDDVNRIYHDRHYGFPLGADDELFGRFILEIFQAGLSWQTILLKQENFRKAFDGFSISRIAAYGEPEIAALMENKGIIRNGLKIRAVIHNAQQILALQQEYGTFRHWLDVHDALSLVEWVRLFKKRFKFVGNEIVNELLMSTGYLRGAHEESCPVFEEIKIQNPNWLKYDQIH